MLVAAIFWSAASVCWAALVGLSSLIAGLVAASVALAAFGANSILDGAASVVLIWRFRHERSGGHAARVEQRAALVVGVIMALLAIWASVSAVAALVGHSKPDASTAGVVLTACSVLVLPVLARAKFRLARRLRSPGLRGDAILSFAGAVLAAATLLSLLLDAALGWWWADDAAALLIAGLLMSEAAETIARHRSLTR
jgi:divalent metal cation (Fe/Co/Zn/Cd) transporter